GQALGNQLLYGSRNLHVPPGNIESHRNEGPSSQLPVPSQTGNWQPETRNSSKEHFPLVRRRDLQLFAVFRDGAARQHQPFFLENTDDLRVAQRLPRVFVFYDLADSLLDRHRRDAFAERTADPAVEK